MDEKTNEKKKVGRKTTDDKVIRSFVYLKTSVVNKHGGWEKIKAKFYEFINNLKE